MQDLELGRAHILEIMEQILPYIGEDPEKKKEFDDLAQDLKKTNNAIDMKRIYQNIKRRLIDMDIGGTGGTKPEDQKEAKRLLMQLDHLPVELFDE